MNTQRIPIVILAAGNSSRMGAIKQLLPWKETTLLENTIEQAIHSDVCSIFVTLGANAQHIEQKINGENITILKNEDWEKGLGQSIAFSIQQINSSNFDGVLLLLADQPAVNTAYINQILQTFTSSDQNIVATQYNNNIGVPVLFDSIHFPELQALTGTSGAKSILKAHPEEIYSITPQQPLIDIDTPEDYEKAREKFGQKPIS